MSRSFVARRLVEHAQPPATVLVARVAGARHLVAAHAIEPGATILELDGIVSDTPDRYSVQIGTREHLAPPPHAGADDDAFFWRYLNHSCDPSAAFVFGADASADARQPIRLVALRPIRRGAEVTFDYNTTEWEMSVPFTCGCARCACEPGNARSVRGYRHLDAAERARLRRLVAPHLLERAREHAETPSEPLRAAVTPVTDRSVQRVSAAGKRSRERAD